MRSKLNDLYLEFDYHAWFWYGKMYNKASYLGLSGGHMSSIKKILSDYEKNLIQSTQTLTVFWDKCLREDYDPSDPNIDSLAKSTRLELNNLSIAREELAFKVASILRIK